MSEIRVDNIVSETGTGNVAFNKGINVTGVVTASGYSGTINATGLTGTPDITVNNITGVAATFTGVLTYEDVTNVDSVGIVTARGGLEVGAAGVGGTITPQGNAIFVGVTTVGLGLTLADNVRAKFGNSGDLSIYHDASNSYIHDEGTGGINLKGSFVKGLNGSNEVLFNAIADGAVELYHNNVKKIETTTGGINVTGAINVNGSALSTAPQITATASGAITAGDRVIVNTNGTVTKVGLSYTAISPIDGLSGSDVNYPDASKDTSYWRVTKIKDNYFFLAYRNETNSNRLDGAQFYIQNDGTVALNTSSQTLFSGQHRIIDVAHDPDREQAVIVYKKIKTT